MQNFRLKKFLLNTFWLSLLIHLLILLYLFFMMRKTSEQQAQQQNHMAMANHYVPAYTYKGSIKPATQSQKTRKKQQTTPKKTHKSDLQINRETGDIAVARETHSLSSSSLLADAFDVIRNEQIENMSEQGEPDPIYLVGDDSQPSDPLIRLIGKSLSKYFAYPETAGRLGIKGRVLVKLTLHPEGFYSDIQIIQSSNNQDLDAAALYAVNSAPPVYGADRFISKPKRMVVGFIFN